MRFDDEFRFEYYGHGVKALCSKEGVPFLMKNNRAHMQELKL